MPTDKGFISRFPEDNPAQLIPEEDQKVQWPKHYCNKNEEGISSTVNNMNKYICVIEKFYTYVYL